LHNLVHLPIFQIVQHAVKLSIKRKLYLAERNCWNKLQILTIAYLDHEPIWVVVEEELVNPRPILISSSSTVLFVYFMFSSFSFSSISSMFSHYIYRSCMFGHQNVQLKKKTPEKKKEEETVYIYPLVMLSCLWGSSLKICTKKKCGKLKNRRKLKKSTWNEIWLSMGSKWWSVWGCLSSPSLDCSKWIPTP
jgi:hypothetical protein